MSASQTIIHRFYEAFARHNAEGMAACYHPEVRFEDPAFGELQGEQVANMWRMLLESQRGKDFRVEASNIACDENTGQAHWEAWYNFSRTGRKVHNKIDATFELRNGLIYRHTDRFDLHRWAGQALGLQGTLPRLDRLFQKEASNTDKRYACTVYECRIVSC